MTTLLRLLIVLAVLGGLGYGGLLLVGMTLAPEQREISVPVAPSKLNR